MRLSTLRSVGFGLILTLALSVGGVAPAFAQAVTVFAAASMKSALDEVDVAWRAQGGAALALTYAGSSALAQQVDQGAPADVVLLANQDWMDWLEDRKRLVPDTLVPLLGNRLVLVAARETAHPVSLDAPLSPLLNGGRLAMALVDAVPAGIYGKAALTSLGLWEDAAPHVAQAENVRIALALVARGEAPLGIVYATDARAEPNVAVVAEFPADSHPPIHYPLALVRDSAEARAFAAFLQTDQARGILTAQGFSILGTE